MVNVERLEAKLKEAGLNVKYRKPGELTLQRCPLHKDKTPSLTISIEKNRYRCWSCNDRGTISKLLSYYGISYGYYNLTPTVNELEELLKESENSGENEPEQSTILPDPKELLGYRYYHPYLESRGFNKEFCLKNKIGFDRNALRVTIPMLFRGEYYGCARRSVVGDIPKIRYNDGIPKEDILYLPLTNHNDGDVFIVVEGPIDALKVSLFGYNVGAILGCQCSDKQMWEIYQQANGKEIILALDNDDPGREGIIKIIDKLYAIDNVTIFKYDENWRNEKGEQIKDPGECTQAMIEWGIENSVSILEY